MNTSLRHLSIARQRQVELAKKIIVQAVQPEKIFLFGAHGDPEEAVFLDDALPPELSALNLLVITRGGDRRSDYELQDIIENRCRAQVAVNALVHDVNYVNRRLMEGQYFFCMIPR